jgi:lipid-A-disaccharide synthase
MLRRRPVARNGHHEPAWRVPRTGQYNRRLPPRLLVSCGEPSGDLYAAELVRHLRPALPALDLFGIGGERLAAQGAALFADVRALAVVGLVEVVTHLRRLRGVLRELLAEVDRRPPAVALLVDYGGFNLRLAAGLRRRGVPVVYYVSPQVWAWRRRRVRTIRDTVSQMLVIFPFEEQIYRDAGVPVRFVGHPLVDLARPAADPAGFLRAHGIDPGRPVLAVLPGSRPKEIAYNLPPIADALRRVAVRHERTQFVLAVAPSIDPAAVRAGLGDLPVTLIGGATHAVLGACTAAIVASGTATVEAALLGAPMVVVYRLSAATYLLGRRFVNVPHYAMANLIAGRRLVPELIQGGFTGQAVAGEALRLLEDPGARGRMKDGLAEVRQRLGGPGASARAAEEVLRVVEGEATRGRKSLTDASFRVNV